MKKGPDTVPLQEDEEGETQPEQETVGRACKASYHGESGYSVFTRGLKHQKSLEKKSTKNALWRHRANKSIFPCQWPSSILKPTSEN